MRWGGEPGEPLVLRCTIQMGANPVCDAPATAVVGTRFTCDCPRTSNRMAVCDEHLHFALNIGWLCGCGAPCYHSEPVAL